jgi:hypothetical protein
MARRRAFVHLGRVSIVWRRVLKRWIAQQLKWEPLAGATGREPSASSVPGAQRAISNKERHLSPEGEARISEAVKRRWAA